MLRPDIGRNYDYFSKVVFKRGSNHVASLLFCVLCSMLTIYDTANEIRFQTPINKGSKRVIELMGANYVLLKFSIDKPIYFQLGDWCDMPGFGRFELVELYHPTYNKATGGYDYDLELEAYYCKWRNKIFKYTPETGGREASWSLTATLDVHLVVFVRNLKALGYTYNGQEFIFSIDETVEQSAKLLTYNNTDMISALNMMAEAWNCEWWIEDHVIYFGRCEFGTPVDFEQGVNVDNISPSGNKNVYATRIYAFGSTRNIPVNYRPADESIVVNGIVQKRLMLPAGIPYVDAYPNMPTEAAVESVVVFDDVYPRTDGTVDSVDTYTDTVTNDDGTTNTETFYRFKDNSIKFSKDYILENEELHIIFQSGSLNGLDFGVVFNPLGVSEKLSDGSWNPDAQLWEIVASEDYGRKLPDTVLMPKAGDKYVLYGWDATKIADLGLIAKAEQELLERTEKYIAKTKIDPNSYPCTMMSDWMLEQGDTPQGFFMPFGLGDKVNLISDALFVNGSRESRIIGIECQLDYPYDSPVITVGETKSTSRLGALEKTIESLTLKGQTFTGGGNSGIYLIATTDTTTPTNRNAFSSLRSLKEFLNKTRSDRTPYGLSVGGLLKAEDRMHFGEFVSGFINGKGAGIGPAGDAEVESIVVRSYMKVFELIYNRLNAQEGEFSFADVGTIERVSEDAGGTLTATMRKRWDGDFTAFQPGDIVYGCVNDLDNKESKEHGKAWARVVSVNRADNTLTLVPYGDGDVPSGHNLALTQEMVITRWGNVISPSAEAHANPDYASFIIEKGGRWINTRQQSFFISCDQGNIVELMGVDSPVLREGNYGTVLGQIPEGLLDEETAKLINPGQPYLYARGIVVQDLIRIGYNGVRVRTPNFRGEWDAAQASGEGYHMTDDICDIVSHGGGMWQCCVETADCDPPSDASKSWARISGNDFSVWDIRPSANVIYIRAGGHSTNLLECTVTKNTGAGVAEFSTPETLDTEGKTLVFTLDGETYGEFWVREGDTVSGEDGLSLELEEGGTLDMGGNNVPWLEVGDYITLELREAGSSQALTKVMVPVVRDGADGGQGAKGEKGDPGRDGSDGKDGSHAEQRFRLVGYNGADPAMTEAERAVREPHGWEAAMPEVGPRDSLWMIQATVFPDGSMDGLWSVPVRMTGRDGEKGADGAPGKTGLMPYPCGKFDPLVTYRASGKATPVVMDGVDGMGMGQYYVLLPGAVYYAGDPGIEWKTPHEDAVNNGGHWERMDRFSSVFADIIMSEFGKIGSAVFSGDWMLSQQGVDDSGNYAENYESFGKGFTPNFSVDFKTGKVVARDIEFYGYARQKLTRITESNLKSYLLYPDDPWDTRALDWRKTGGSVWLEGLDRGVAMFMPDMKLLTNETEISRARMYAGVTGVIYNASDVDIAFSTCWRGVTPFGVTGGEMSDFQGTSRNTFLLASGEGVCMRCTLGVEYHVEKKQNGKYVKVVDNNGDEELVWDIETFFKIKKGES